jgi:hypothetical protein
MSERFRRGMVAMTAASLLCSACTTIDSVPMPRSDPRELRTTLRVGETVVVKTYDRREKKLRILALEEDAIVGRRVRISYDDVLWVNRLETDYKGTVMSVLAVTALVVVYLGAAVLEAETEDEY